MTPLVSIIIPVYNRAELLIETLDSIKTQSYTNFECIIIDDGSTDNSISVCECYSKRDSRFKAYSRPMNIKKGANPCRNYGLSLSKGEYINWFDSDDIMHKNMIEKMVQVAKNTSADMVICKASFFTTDTNVNLENIKLSIKFKTNNPAFEFIASGYWFGTPQPLLKKAFLQNQKYYFDDNLQRNQETEFFVRLLIQNPSIEYLNETMVYIRKHSVSIGGIYQGLSIEKKMILDYPAYAKMYTHFKKYQYLDNDVLNYFKDFFFRCLRQMEFKPLIQFRLLLYCINNNVVPIKKGIKIFIIRFYHYFINNGKNITNN